MKIITKKNIVLIGAGNVATQLGIAFYKEGYVVSQVFSRTKKSAERLAKQLNAQAIVDIKKLRTDASIYIIAVKDDAIATIAKKLKLKNQLVVHTSGTLSINVLKKTSKNIGVFYPLQTFSLEKNIDFKTVPICIEANNKNATALLHQFSTSISNDVQTINSDQRKIIHLAAVFACNFSNHLFTIAATILEKNNLSFNILKPLIQETADKIQLNAPSKMQTGPAIRGDKKTMDAQLKLLSSKKEYKQLYKLLSKDIITAQQQN